MFTGLVHSAGRIVELTPRPHQGMAMALFSQCFALSGLLAPPLAGLALDRQGHGGGLWIVLSLLCLAGFSLSKRLAPRSEAVRMPTAG